MRHTHTLATLAVSPDAYTETRDALVVAGYDHAVLTDKDGETLDMTGIALARDPASGAAADTAEDWHWYFGIGSEPDAYTRASANTREAALADAVDELDLDTAERCVTLCMGLPATLIDAIFSADDVIEQWHDKNEEVASEDGDLSMQPSASQKAELEAVLNATFAAWRKRHGLGRAYSLTTRQEEVVLVSDDGTTDDQGEA